MKRKQRNFILKNLNRRSIKEIAEELNVKEREVRRFIEKKVERRSSLRSSEKERVLIRKSSTLLSLALIIIFGFLVYGNSLDGEFIWDDVHLIKNNIHIRDWHNIPDIFSKNIGAGAGRKSYFYRPLQILTYMIDYRLWKFNVFGFHFTNILLHILVALSICWLVTLLSSDWILSLFTALLFLVHPIHTEAVAYISGRADPLATFFMLSCLILYIKNHNTKNLALYFLMLFSYTLALLSRENSLILPLLILLYHYIFRKRLGFFLLLGRFLTLLYQRDKLKGSILFTLLLVFHSFLTVKQNNYWREPEEFYRRTLKYAPGSARVYNSLGIDYERRGDYEKAITSFKKAIEIEPSLVYAYNNLGKLYNSLGRKKEAMDYYLKAIEIDPGFADVHYNLGNLYSEIKDYQKAIVSCQRAIEINP